MFLREDRLGRIWVGAEGTGFSQYNRASDNFTHYSSKDVPETRGYTFAEDSLGQIWVGDYSNGGLGLVDTTQNQLINTKN